jgi:hypothetical protein
MIRRLVIEPEAELELDEAAERYEGTVPGLGLEFLSEMRHRTNDVREAPDRYPPFGGVPGVRCAHAVERFPHLVVYLTLDETVHVLAYMHPRRRPDYWVRRLPRR